MWRWKWTCDGNKMVYAQFKFVHAFFLFLLFISKVGLNIIIFGLHFQKIKQQTQRWNNFPQKNIIIEILMKNLRWQWSVPANQRETTVKEFVFLTVQKKHDHLTQGWKYIWTANFGLITYLNENRNSIKWVVYGKTYRCLNLRYNKISYVLNSISFREH